MTETLTPPTTAPVAPAPASLTPEAGLLAPVYALPRPELRSGRGAWVLGSDGTRYLDFVSGIAVNALGHAPPALIRTVAKQMRSLMHVSNLFGHEPGIELARALTAATGYPRVFFCNSGTEGIESALKFSRVLARARGREARGVLAFHGGFHGRTAFALSATYHPDYRAPFEPLMPGVRFAPFNDVAALTEALTDDIAAVIVEPVQGEGGAIPAEPRFLTAVVARAKAVGAALIFDEVQSGMGRCGHLLASEHYGVRADYVVLSKALGGGLPLAAVLMTEAASQALAPGMHGCTFGGSPVATCAGGYILSQVNRPLFLAKVRARGRQLAKELQALKARHPSLAAARGLGLLTAVEIAKDAPYAPADLVRTAREHGLLVVRGGERAVRLLPPLVVKPAEITEAVARLDRALTALETKAPSLNPSGDTQ